MYSKCLVVSIPITQCSEIENILIGRENKTIRQAVKDKRNVIVQYI